MSLNLMRVAYYALWTAGLATVLVIMGAIPGLSAPSYGQSIWALGFATSIANDLGVYARNIGAPSPAAIAFGLPAILPMAAAIKIGFSDANAYAAGFGLWVVVAFFGANRLALQIGANRPTAVAAAVLWFCPPIIWMHTGYSMLGLGFALLPFYLSCAWPICWRGSKTLGNFLQLALGVVVALFMDGYSFVMLAVAVSIVWLAGSTYGRDEWKDRLVRLLAIAAAFLLAVLLYYLFARSSDGQSLSQSHSLDFFRAWGANIEFFFMPPVGVNWLADIANFSRESSSYFGDASVFTTTYVAPVVVLGLAAIAVGSGDRKLTWAFIAVGMFGFYMALGPSLKLFTFKPDDVATPLMASEFAPIPTGSALISKFLPGFNEMRAAYRWTLLGLLGFWAAFLASVPHRTGATAVYSFATVVVVALLIMPPIGRFQQTVSARERIQSIEVSVPEAASGFVAGEKVFFLPVVNDFFVTYLAPKAGITTPNIGGDKNLAAASASWPEDLKWFLGKSLAHPEFAEKITAILGDGTVDAVALSFFNSRAPVNEWPVPMDQKDAAVALASKLEEGFGLSATQTEYYAIIRN